VEHDQVAQQRVPFDGFFLLGRVVLGDHALVAEPGPGGEPSSPTSPATAR
jgi:hypothetical protein